MDGQPKNEAKIRAITSQYSVGAFMVNVELQSLVQCMSSKLKSTLELAAGECVSRHHFAIELEHWFYKLLQESDMGWVLAAQSAGIAIDVLTEQLNSELTRYKAGNDNSPSLSSQLIELLKDAWMLASLNLSQLTVNEYHLLLVLKQRVTLGAYTGCLTEWIKNLSSEWLKQQALKTSGKVVQSTSNNSETAVSKEAMSNQSTPALDKYTQNFTQAARNGELDIVSGRSLEIRKTIDILCRRRQNSPILVGDPGVGKTAIVEGLAQLIVEGNVPPILEHVELLSLDLSLLQAGASIKGEFENRLKDIISEIKQSTTPMIIFIDEAHTLIGAGGAAGQNDAANILKPALARGEFRSIAATTWAEYKQYFEKDAALTRRFQVVEVQEPDEATAVQMLRGIKASLETHHNVRILQEALEAAVSLSIRYLPERKLPDKAISLLDTACSRVGLSQNAIPHQLTVITEQINQKESEIQVLMKEDLLCFSESTQLDQIKQQKQDYLTQQSALRDKWEAEKTSVTALLSLQAELEKRVNSEDISPQQKLQKQTLIKQQMQQLSNVQQDSPLVWPQVSKQTIAEVVAQWTGVPVNNMIKQDVERLLNIESSIGKRVIGQCSPISEIAEVIRISRAGLSDPRKPLGVFLMCGPSGVGKTETALALAEELFGSENSITTINMTEFKEAHKVSMLLGAPAGYVGYGKGGVLTEAVRKKPYSLILLDEVDKAHPSVQDIFYQIFDKGSISDSEGRHIDFKNCLIIMTTNVGDTCIVNALDEGFSDTKTLQKRVFPELQKSFSTAFLGRLSIIPYHPLSDSQLEQITMLSLNKVEQSLSKHYGATLAYEPSVIEFLLKQNQSPEIGARAIEQQISQWVMPQIANSCIDKMSIGQPFSTVTLTCSSGQMNVDIH
ncbi:type VI secretion system ATPase TssH [Parashewanella tropica]|uniref:type VI secretion system ATPase TssH n=1 Tax=Parashewanella tropica TaxID=2547970 RepID=UPI001FE5FFB8|nr:type VI secretion system ATPase TssH [Parashewanella tropica]